MATVVTAESAPKAPLVFLSHAGADGEAARALAALLRGAGMEVWLDVERLQPGDMWQREISTALRSAQALILYVGRSGVARWVDFEVQLALDRSAKEREFRIIPVLGPASDPNALPDFVRLFQWLDLREPQPSPEKLKKLVAGILKAAAEQPVSVLPPDRSPFVGLCAFDVDDAILFFGREAETQELLECLQRDSLLLVVGDSGCGKSSLVRAGLIPALLRGRFHDGRTWVTSWQAAITRPGSDPFGELAENLPDLQTDCRCRAEQVSSNRKLLAEGVDGLRDIIAGSAGAGERTLLVIDQFEELFTLTPDRATRRRFIDCLLRAADPGGSRPVHVVLTLRADFYARCWEHPELPSRGARNQYPVRRMRANTLRQLIERPLSLAGARAEAGLVETILEEVGDAPGNLALLEHALDQLWRNRRVDGEVRITHDAYDRLQRLSGALQRHANDAMKRLPDDAARELAWRFFVELIQLGEGTEDTRRRAAIRELLATAGDRDKAQQVLAQLASERLIITGEEYAEVAHEELIRTWPELRNRVDAERGFVRIERQLLDGAREWDRLHRDPGALLAGAQLREAEDLLASTRREAAPLVREFLDASRAAERKAALFKRAVQSALALASVAVACLGLIAWNHRRQNAWLDLLLAARNATETDSARANFLALHAQSRRPDSRAALAVLHEAAQAARLPEIVGHAAPITASVFSPDGKRVATGDSAGVLKLWAAETGGHIADAPAALGDAITALAFSDATILAGTAGGELAVWKPGAPQLERAGKMGSAIRGIATTSGGGILAALERAPGIYASSGTVPRPPHAPDGYVSLDMAPNARLMVFAGGGNRIEVLDGGKTIEMAAETGSHLRGAAFMHGGQSVFAWTKEGGLSVWPVSPNSSPTRLALHLESVEAADTDGQRVFAIVVNERRDAGSLVVWNPATAMEELRFRLLDRSVEQRASGLRASRAGNRLAIVVRNSARLIELDLDRLKQRARKAAGSRDYTPECRRYLGGACPPWP